MIKKALEISKPLVSSESAAKVSISSRKGGSLYTWGSNLQSLGYYTDKLPDPDLRPHKVETFHNNVAKVSMGPYHTGVVTVDGELYTFGRSAFGALGHGDKNVTYTKPKAVVFFKRNNLKVIDVACGERYTLAVTDDGDVWSWGSGRRSDNFLTKLFPSDSNSLGHGSKHWVGSPSPVEALRKTPPTIGVVAGYKFCMALNVKKNLFYWGKGDYGVFGEGYVKGEKIPKLHKFFKELQKQNGMKIKKIKACANYSMALFNNGSLWAWGENESGQLGIEENYDDHAENVSKIATAISQKSLGGQRVKDFDLGEEISVILTTQNQVYWSGLKLSAKPTLLRIPEEEKIVKVGAANSSIAAVSDNNVIYTKNNFLASRFENHNTGVGIGDFPEASRGKILDIGGAYNNKFVILHE